MLIALLIVLVLELVHRDHAGRWRQDVPWLCGQRWPQVEPFQHLLPELSNGVVVRVCSRWVWVMVVRFVRVIRVPACARVSRESRVCPGSPRCLFTGRYRISEGRAARADAVACSRRGPPMRLHGSHGCAIRRI